MPFKALSFSKGHISYHKNALSAIPPLPPLPPSSLTPSSEPGMLVNDIIHYQVASVLCDAVGRYLPRNSSALLPAMRPEFKANEEARPEELLMG